MKSSTTMKPFSPAASKPGADHTDRRGFLKMGLALGAGATLLGPLNALAAVTGKGPVRVQDTRVAMGTFVTMTVIASSHDQAAEAIDSAFSEISRLTAILDRHNPDTPLSWLNSKGVLNHPDPELVTVAQVGAGFHKTTDGAFDISVLPLVQAFEENAASGSPATPDQGLIKEALEMVDSNAVRISPRTIRFERQGMGITLDGIAKGYIVDRASSILRAHEVTDHLINAGGDIRASQGRYMQRPWVIAVEDPKKQGHRPDVISLRYGAVATSGGYEIFDPHDRARHHIIDPTIGTSPSQIVSASVTAPSVMEADALSTSVLILGPRRGISLLNSLPGRNGYLMAADMGVTSTLRWPSRNT